MKYRGKTLQEWLDLYNGMVLNDILDKLVLRLYPGLNFSFKDKVMSYENLKMVNKPPISLFESELVIFVSDRISFIEQIFDEMAKDKIITDRLALLKYPTEAALMASGRSNAKIVIRDLIKSRDLDLLTLMEAKDVEFEAVVLAQDNKGIVKRDAKVALSGHIGKLQGNPSVGDLKDALLDVLKIMDG